MRTKRYRYEYVGATGKGVLILDGSTAYTLREFEDGITPHRLKELLDKYECWVYEVKV